jgi:uncharacterized protein
MLVEFRFQNFRIFKDEQVLSFVASNDKSLPENVITPIDLSGIGTLRSALIFGANASGKTTILDALNFSRKLIKSSAKNEPTAEIGVEPFLFDEEYKSSPTSFEFTIIITGIRYRYGFTVNRQRVLKEWLISYPKGKPRKLFERWINNENIPQYIFGSFLKGEKEKLTEVTRENALFLSVGATFNNPQLINIYNWFSNHLVGINTREINEQGVYQYLAENPSQLEQIIKLINYADLGIVDISFVEKDLFKTLKEPAEGVPENLKNAFEAVNKALNELILTTPDIKDRKYYSINMIHQAGNEKFKLSWDLESAGTHQLLFLSAPVFKALNDGNFIFIDEFDNSLHPLLLRELIKLFNNPSINTRNAQLLFNTHDTTLLSTNLFRRDQVWFVEKDKQHVSHLYSLIEFSPRKDEALEKGYLKGRYGAVPFFGEFLYGVSDLEQKKELIPE